MTVLKTVRLGVSGYGLRTHWLFIRMLLMVWWLGFRALRNKGPVLILRVEDAGVPKQTSVTLSKNTLTTKLRDISRVE